MSHSSGMNSENHIQLTEGRELIDIAEAASLYGCQRDRIQNFIARGMLHPFLDVQEVDGLRQKHLYKQANGRSAPLRKRH